MVKVDLIIDPGHGGKDPGAVAGKEMEKDWVLKISLYQQKRLKELGVNVGLTRSTDHGYESYERTKIVQDSGAKYCFSNHLNAGGGDRGEVIHSIHNDGKFPLVIKDALVGVGQTAVKIYCRASEKNKNVDYYFMHRETGNVTTFIIEYCFLDNAADFQHFKNNWEAYAEAVIKAYCSFTGHPYKAVGVPVKPTPTPPKPAPTPVPKDPAEETELDKAIKYVKEANLSDGSDPESFMTRSQLFRILYRLDKNQGGKK